MKQLLLGFLTCLLWYPLRGQITLSDDFSDGDFRNNPSWSGDTGLFVVNANQSLQLQDTAAGQAYLSTISPIGLYAQWRWALRLDFNPSGSNFARYYLMSDQANLHAPLNGYFVQISGSSADRIGLYRQSGQSISSLIETDDDWADTDPVQAWVEVSRSAQGLWKLRIDTGQRNGYALIDSAIDLQHRFSTHLGLAYHYTSTRADRFFLDSVFAQGQAFTDNQAPRLDSLRVINANTLQLVFSETLEESSAEDPQNYLLDPGLGNPALAVLDANKPNQVELGFSQLFQNRQNYRLSLQGVRDRFGNDSAQSRSFVYFRPEAGDLVINELMVDPSPSVGIPPQALPEREYLEIYNRSPFPVDLEGWILEMGSNREVLPPQVLAPQEFLVVVDEDGLSEFPANLPLLGLDMSSTVLANSGSTVILRNPEEEVISLVSYTDDWYADPNKDEGGWSLEQIDPDNRCGGAGNWRASVDPSGGTPGRGNSVAGLNPDTVGPFMERLALPGDSLILVVFSEPLAEGAPQRLEQFRLTPNPGLLAFRFNLARDEVQLQLSQPLQRDTLYRLYLDTLPRDCSGNLFQPDTLLFALPSPPQAGEILINEILFNPPSGGSDFVELYHNGKNPVDLAHLALGNWDPVGQQAENSQPLREESFLFFPGEYLALSEDPDFLRQAYPLPPDARLLEVEDLPSLPDQEGSLCLSLSNLQVVDYFQYDDDFHLPVLDDTEGVSLERRDPASPTQERANWHSAAAAVGFATPGYENSQLDRFLQEGLLLLEPEVFSPNQDGFQDLLNITLNFSASGSVVNIWIFEPGGQRVRTLVEQENIGPEARFSWDGTDNSGQLLSRGIYIVLVEYFRADGAVGILRETAVLSR